MSYWIHNTGNKNSSLWRFFMCDYLRDISDLPDTINEGLSQPNDTVCKNKCSPGSQCFCLEDGSTWILGKDTNKWTKTNISSSLSGGTTIIEKDIKSISSASIESLFS